MASKRRTQWIDAVQSTQVNVAGAAAPGTVVDTSIIGEAELENLGAQGLTLIRVIGDLWFRRTAGTAVLSAALWDAPNYAGAVWPTDWVQDTYERRANLGSWSIWVSSVYEVHHIKVDLRTKRKMSSGNSIVLSLQNHSIAGNDAQAMWHLRALVLLP